MTGCVFNLALSIDAMSGIILINCSRIRVTRIVPYIRETSNRSISGGNQPIKPSRMIV